MERLAGTVGALVAGVAFIGAIGWLNVAAWGAWSQQRRLQAEGVRTVAEVLATQEIDVPRSDGQRVTVRFDVSGEPVTVEVEVDEPTLERAIRAGSLDIVHDPDDPIVVAVAGDGRAGMMAMIAGIVDVTLIGGMVTLVANDRKGRRLEGETG